MVTVVREAFEGWWRTGGPAGTSCSWYWYHLKCSEGREGYQNPEKSVTVGRGILLRHVTLVRDHSPCQSHILVGREASTVTFLLCSDLLLRLAEPRWKPDGLEPM